MKKIFITGISSGLGKALTKELINQGNRVFGIARRKKLLVNLAKELVNSKNFNYSAVDISQKTAWNNIINQLIQLKFVPSVVIFNAAIYQDSNSGSFDSEVVRNAFEVNFFANLRAVEAIKSSFPNKKVYFLAISSSSAFKGSKSEGIAYATSKAALSVAFESFHKRYKKTNFSFGIIYFGPIKTGMNPYPQKNFFVLREKQAVDAIIKAINERNAIYYYPKLLFFLLFILKLFPPKLYLTITEFFENFRKKFN